MTFLQVRYFIEAARQQSITKAAEKLYVSQQAVSKQIKALEQELRFPLFSVQKKQLMLTVEGARMRDLWEELLFRMDEEIRIIQGEREQKERLVRIGILEYDAVKDLTLPLLAQYGSGNPDIQIEVVSGNPAYIKQLAKEKKADLIVTYSTEIPKELICHQRCLLKTVQLSIILSKNHPLAERKELSLTDIADETIFIFEDSHSADAQKKILGHFHSYGIEPKVKYFKSWESMEIEIMAGKGIATGFREFFRNQYGGLKFYPIAYLQKDEPAQISIVGVNELGEHMTLQLQKLYQNSHVNDFTCNSGIV